MGKNKLFAAGALLVVLIGTIVISKVGAQSRVNFAGSYTINGINPDGSKYVQSAIVTDYGDGYQVLYDTGDTGIASDIGNTIAIGSQSKGVPSVTILKIINGSQLEGYWQEYTSTKEGQEVWTIK